MRAAQIDALKRSGKVIGFEAEPYSLDESAYATHKGGLMEYSAISRFVIVANDTTGTRPIHCTANIPMSDTALMLFKMKEAISTLTDLNFKKALAAEKENGLSENTRQDYLAEIARKSTLSIYNSGDKILMSRKDKDGHSLVYNVSITCDTSRDAPYIFSIVNFFSAVSRKNSGIMNYYGTQYNRTCIKFYATEAEAYGLIEHLHTFASDYTNNTFSSQLELMQKLNAQERQLAKDSKASTEADAESSQQDAESEVPDSTSPTVAPNTMPPSDKAPVASRPTPIPRRSRVPTPVSAAAYDPDSCF